MSNNCGLVTKDLFATNENAALHDVLGGDSQPLSCGRWLTINGAKVDYLCLRFLIEGASKMDVIVTEFLK